MPDTELPDLLGTVRRRLWRGRFVSAARRALWGSAAVLVLAIALTLFARPISFGAVGVAVSGLWLLLGAWAAGHRPTDSACALWADRHLGGASAFTTLLELHQGDAPKPDAAALRQLKLWSANKVPACLKALAERPDPPRLARPLLTMVVCAALAALVLGLSEPGPAPVQQASSPLPAGDRAAAAIDPSEGRELASEIAKAVRAAESRQAAERHEAGRTAETANNNAADGRPPRGDRAMTVPPGARPNSTPTSEEAFVQPRKDPSAGTATDSGRDAGNSLDRRADTGISRAPQGTIAAQGYELKARRRSDEMQAAMDQQGSYDEAPTIVGDTTARPAVALAAATPPTATAASWLTPTETSYVQAWMKASARPR